MSVSFSTDSQGVSLIVSEEYKLFDWVGTAYIGTPAITSTGVQWSDEKTIATGGGTSQVFGAIVNPPKSWQLVSTEFGFSFQIKSGGVTQNKWYQWRARNMDGTWINLHGSVSGSVNSSYMGTAMSGVITAQTNFNQVPFEVGLFAVSSAAETFLAQVKNSSYVVVKYRP